MTPVEFEALFRETNFACAALLNVKRGEYAGQEGERDVLANFKDAGRRVKLLAEKDLIVLADKHWASILNFIDDLQNGRDRPKSEAIHGRIYDLINYMHLLLALLAERAETAAAVRDEGRVLRFED